MSQETKYNWDQELNEVTITFEDENITTRDITYTFNGRNLTIKNKDQVIVDGKLLHPIIPSTAGWMVDNGVFTWYGAKYKTEWWDTLIEGSTEKVDVSKLAENKVTSLDMLDPEAKQVVEKMMFEQKEKNANPNFEQNKAAEMIKRLEENKPRK